MERVRLCRKLHARLGKELLKVSIVEASQISKLLTAKLSRTKHGLFSPQLRLDINQRLWKSF